jgi:hypothetical protein
VRSASGDDGRKLFQCGAQRARIQGPRCNEPVRQSTIYNLTIMLYSSVITTHVYNDINYSVPLMMSYPSSTVHM